MPPKTRRNDMKRTIDGLGNACCLYAMKAVSGIKDSLIITACRLEGFQTTTGMHQYQWLAAMKRLGIRYREVKDIYAVAGGWQDMTLSQFAKRYPVGVFYVTTSRHAFAVRDGHVIDNKKFTGGRRRVRSAFRILNPSKEKRVLSGSLEKDPVLEIVRFGAMPYGQSTKALVWWKLWNNIGGSGAVFRWSEVSSYFSRFYMADAVKLGALRALEGRERKAALLRIGKLRYEEALPTE